MSRYANRLAPPPANRYQQQRRGYYDEPGALQGRGYRGGQGQEDDDDGEDDDTAVATDLSIQRAQQARRGVQFGENEVEEFNGSEAPDAVLPARSRSRMGLSPPVPVGRPRAGSIDGRRSAQPLLPPAPAPTRTVVTDARYAEMPPPPVPVRGRYDPPVSFARSTAFDEDDDLTPVRTRARGWTALGDDDDEPDTPRGDKGDDDDAFTAIATGVATDLDMDDGAMSSRRAAEDPRARMAALQQQREQSSFLAVPRPPSRGVQVRRASPLPHPAQAQVQRVSASGYEPSDFSSSADEAPPLFQPAWQQQYEQPRQRFSQQLPPPPVAPVQRSMNPGTGVGRPVSSASSRMRVDEEEEGYASPPPARAVAYERPPTRERERERDEGQEDSPLERELIALLKELRFSIALKDFHDTMRVGVQKTLVTEDGMGHAYVKIHVKRLPRHEDIAKEHHLKQHWVPLAGSRWEFRTASHRVTVVFKTAALAAYEAQFLTARR